MTIERRHVGKRLSDIVIYAPRRRPLVYLAGQVAEDPTRRHQRADAVRCSRRSTGCSPKPAPTSADPVGDDLPAGHGRLRRDERRVGRVGAAGRDAGARDRRGEARQSRLQGRDPGRRRARLDAHDPTDPADARAPRRRKQRRSPRRRGATSRRASNAASLPVTRAMFDRADGAVLRAGAVRAGARRRLARLGPGRPDVHRLRERRRGHGARPLPSGDGRARSRSRRASSGTCRTGSPTSRRCGSRSASSTRRSPSACSSATPAPRPTRRR